MWQNQAKTSNKNTDPRIHEQQVDQEEKEAEPDKEMENTEEPLAEDADEEKMEIRSGFFTSKASIISMLDSKQVSETFFNLFFIYLLCPILHLNFNIHSKHISIYTVYNKRKMVMSFVFLWYLFHVLKFFKTEFDHESARQELEEQLASWAITRAEAPQDEQAAIGTWRKYENLTSAVSQQLCEQLRLVLEPTLASKLK